MRVDVALVRRGLATSRTQAQRLVREGRVRCAGTPVDRPSLLVGPDELLEVTGGQDYVSRAALKLAGALDTLATHGEAPAVAGRRVLDAGASTGGFTDVVLRRGAAHVVAVDVGSGQLDPRIRADERVTVLEHTNVRSLEPAAIGGPAELLVADLSFISLTLVLAPLAACLTADADALVLVKPQFEVGRERLGRGGIVTDPAAHRWSVVTVLDAARAAGLVTAAVLPSPIAGTHGNRELVAWLRRDARPTASTSAVPSHVVEAEHARLAAVAVDGGLGTAQWEAW